MLWSKSRNDRIFNNKVKEGDEMVEETKVLSWNWCLNRLKVPERVLRSVVGCTLL